MAVCERSKQRAKHTLTRNCCAVIAVMIVFGTAGCGAQKPAASLPGKPEPAAVTTPAPKTVPRPTTKISIDGQKVIFGLDSLLLQPSL